MIVGCITPRLVISLADGLLDQNNRLRIGHDPEAEQLELISVPEDVPVCGDQDVTVLQGVADDEHVIRVA